MADCNYSRVICGPTHTLKSVQTSHHHRIVWRRWMIHIESISVDILQPPLIRVYMSHIFCSTSEQYPDCLLCGCEVLNHYLLWSSILDQTISDISVSLPWDGTDQGNERAKLSSRAGKCGEHVPQDLWLFIEKTRPSRFTEISDTDDESTTDVISFRWKKKLYPSRRRRKKEPKIEPSLLRRRCRSAEVRWLISLFGL